MIDDEDFVPAGDPVTGCYFERLRRGDHKAWLNEETVLKDEYDIHRLDDHSYNTLVSTKPVKHLEKEKGASRNRKMKKVWDDASYDPLWGQNVASQYLYISF